MRSDSPKIEASQFESWYSCKLSVRMQVKHLYDLDPKEEFREVNIPSVGRPRPLHLGTASQIGNKFVLPISCFGRYFS
jgi:hypothetical protein